MKNNDIPVAFITAEQGTCYADRCLEPGVIWYGKDWICIRCWCDWHGHRARKGWLVFSGKEN